MEIITVEYTVEEATEEDLVKAFDESSEEDQFIILAGDEGFIQASLSGDGPYIMEFKDPTDPLATRGHDQFGCDGVASVGEVQVAFVQYFRGEPSWRNDRAWRVLDLPGSSDSHFDVIFSVVVILLLVGGVLVMEC
jgi:hypothetical protein